MIFIIFVAQFWLYMTTSCYKWVCLYDKYAICCMGVDDETVYTSNDVAGSELAGEADLRKYIRLPEDLCVASTQDTKGSVFGARQQADPRSVVQKKFVDVWVRTISRKASPADCRVCQCVADETGSGKSRCSSCRPHNPIYGVSITTFKTF